MAASWTKEDVLSLLEHIKDMNVMHILDGKAVRNAHVYQALADRLNIGKTAVQVQNKWKKLKSKYISEKSKANKSGMMMLKFS